jgi:hypothetical protein
MHELWRNDFESMEAISQNDFARRLFLRMAALSQEGRLGALVGQLQDDEELDAETRGNLVELAADPAFLFAVRAYLHRTHVAH